MHINDHWHKASQSQLRPDAVILARRCRCVVLSQTFTPIHFQLNAAYSSSGLWEVLEYMSALSARGRITSQTGHHSHTHTSGQFKVSNQPTGACSVPEDPHRHREDANLTGKKPQTWTSTPEQLCHHVADSEILNQKILSNHMNNVNEWTFPHLFQTQ